MLKYLLLTVDVRAAVEDRPSRDSFDCSTVRKHFLTKKTLTILQK